MGSDELRAEQQRQRDRTHQLASDVVAVRLEQADLKGRLKVVEHTLDKYVPVIERLDDAAIEQRAIARRAARDAAIIVAGVGVLGAVVQIAVTLFTHGVHP